ncbi:ROK family transcriptional regulator [Terriglobus aquaticus]|uniref:ROK family protein n=1 Tax=Terriglobus aquaticus TaxID=940139 RepID=A0ABW9KJL8_9BACT|nr:ROK family transcriptional regulator [Terriglobus aquaticus]
MKAKKNSPQATSVAEREARGKRSVREFAWVEAASSELTRDINRDLILEQIRSRQPISRVALARHTGLQPSTVSSIVEQLKQERWIKEGPAVQTPRGRRPTMVTLNDDLLMLVADVRPSQAVLAVVDLNGRFLSRRVVPLPTAPEGAVMAIASGFQALRDGHPGKVFEGVGISVPGRVNPETNALMLIPNLNWMNYDVSGKLSEILGLTVEIENDANACLLSELWFGNLDGLRNVVLLAISEGLGAALLVEGRLVSGSNGLAGEFGHVTVDADGPKCGCGKQGCWEVFASSQAAQRYYAEQRGHTGKISMRELVSLALDDDEAAKAALRQQCEHIGSGLRVVNASLAPEAILFAGEITTFWSLASPIIEAECKRGLLAETGPRLISTGDGELALLRGAAAVVLHRHSGYYRASSVRNRKASS